eukprot:Opistho-1_new@6230
MHIVHYVRTEEQDHFLGLYKAEGDAPEVAPDEVGRDEVMMIPTNCSRCHAPAPMLMKVVAVPHFKDVIIMAVTCEACGHKSNEVKASGEIAAKGQILKLHIKDSDDLSRDVLKSDTAKLVLPELGLDMESGSLGSRFTTVEGLLTQLKEELTSANPFVIGDSSDPQQKARMADFMNQLDEIIEGKRPALFIIDDPAGNSHIQNLYAPDPDPSLEIEEYERTEEQNEELGLTHMVTEGYSAHGSNGPS